MRHVLFSYHTCPLEEPGTGLAGGMNVFLRGLLPGLLRHGIRTEVYTRGKGNDVLVTDPFPGVRVHHVPCGWEEPPSRESAFRSLPLFSRRAGEILRAGRDAPGVVSAHYWMSGRAARAGLGGLAGMVLAYHTVEVRKRRLPGISPDALSEVRSEAERELAEAAHRVVFLSEHDRAETGKVVPQVKGKEVVIPPGVDDSFRHPPAREEARRVLGVPREVFLFLLAARPDPGKNAGEAVKAFLSVAGEVRGKVLLLVAGQPPPGGNVPDGVIFAGPVPHARMPAMFSAADAAVCPSTYESFGLVPLEAMAAGVPVIAPSSSHWGERIRADGGGIVYLPEASGGIEEAMRRIVGNEAARMRMAEEGRRIAARFTWERCTDSWARLLGSASTRGNPR